MEIVIRDYNPKTDDPYIYSTWTKYSWYSPKEEIHVSKKEYFSHLIQHIKYVLMKGETKIACLKDDPYVIIGYIVMHENNISWKCIKKDYHNQGIDELLIKSIKGKINEEK